MSTKKTKKARKPKVVVSLPKGDKIIGSSPVIKCERGHTWYVDIGSEETVFSINGGCHRWDTWDDAFDHYRISNWYVDSTYASDNYDPESEVELEKIRLRCIERLKYLRSVTPKEYQY